MKQQILPKRIVEQKNIQNADLLLKKRINQILLYEEDMVDALDGSYIVLDFGKEMCGGIKLLIQEINSENGMSKIRVRFGESLSEAYSDIGQNNSTNDHSIRDDVYTVTQLSTVSIGETGFRFVRIDFYGAVQIKSIYANNNILSVRLRKGYNGEDKRIKQIFNVAKRTVDLCSSLGCIWDGIKRDRLIWAGDLYPEVLSLTSMYGRVKCIEKSLEIAKLSPRIEDKWMCGIPTYSLWWIACVAEYYIQTENYEFIKNQLDEVEKIINVFDFYIQEDGSLTYPDYFVDWPTRFTDDEVLGCKFITIFALNRVNKMYKLLSIPTQKIDKIILKLKKGDLSVKEKKQVIGLKYCAVGKITDDEYDTLIQDGAKGFSTFMSYFILTAIASRNKQLAIDLMKEYYGGMLDKGATTFWEDFDVSWIKGSNRIDCKKEDGQKDIHADYGNFCYKGYRHSLCHAWSSGVIKFIEENC